MATKPEFNIQSWFDHYLKLSNVDKSKINPVQLSEMKKAFMAGISSFHVDLIAESKLPEDEIVMWPSIIDEQLRNFWNAEVEDYNEKNK